MGRKMLALPAMMALASLPALAQVSTSYRYDPLGRVLSSATTGAPSGNRTNTITYDAASNRSNYKSSDGATVPPTTPAPSGPVALNPTLSFGSSTTNGIALSTLANASAAARIVAFSPPSGGGTATIAADGQSVSYVAPYAARGAMCEPGETFQYSVPYTVQNVSGGQSASGTATIRVSGGAGPRPRPPQQCP